MSLSFLSRRDVEGWVPEPAPSKGGACFVAKLFVTISSAISALASVLSKTDDEVRRRCRNEFERLFLWGQGLSVADGDLDEVLACSKELHFRVLSLLLRLGTVTLQGLSRTPASLSRAAKEHCDELQTMLDAAENTLREPGPDDPTRPDSPSGSDVSDYGPFEIVEEISVYVDCLLDLSSSLDNPALDVQVEGPDEPSARARESFNVASEEALIYCRRLRDRFEALPKYLVERLAEANVLRAAELREMRSRPAKHDAPIGDDATESLFSTADPRLTETTKSTAPSSSVFSHVVDPPVRWSKASFGDNASEATFASFSTATSATSMGRPRVPPMPRAQWSGFACPFCFVHVTGVNTRTGWKKHVFDDLRPYVCTVEDCKDAVTMYAHSGTWGRHEASHPSLIPRSSECPFCAAAYVQRGTAYYKHVSAHLREVSLAVLPQPAGDDDDDGFDTNNSSPLSSPSIPENAADETADSAEAVAPRAAAGTASSPEENDLDSIIDRLLEVRGSGLGKGVLLPETDVLFLCAKAREILLSQPMLLELAAPVTVVGDIHGQYHDLLRSFEYSGFPPEKNYLFLGNYVDHGTQSLEVMCLTLAYKIKYPENFFLLRGNHECASINRVEGFYDECKRRYSIRLWKYFTDVFNCMPVAAIIDEKIFCVHGGLSPDLQSMENIRRIMRPTDIPDIGLLTDLLWSDPDHDVTGWLENDRGVSFTFGADVVSRFLQKHDMDLIVRGHQVVEAGYEFFAKRQLVTVWGAPNYKGEYDNAAAVMNIDDSLLCSFQILKPAEKRIKFERQ